MGGGGGWVEGGRGDIVFIGILRWKYDSSLPVGDCRVSILIPLPFIYVYKTFDFVFFNSRSIILG